MPAAEASRLTVAVVQGNVVYFIESEITAVRLPDKAAAQFRGTELWSGPLAGEFYASPVVEGGRIYTVDEAASYYVLDADNGVRSAVFRIADDVYRAARPMLATAPHSSWRSRRAGWTCRTWIW